MPVAQVAVEVSSNLCVADKEVGSGILLSLEKEEIVTCGMTPKKLEVLRTLLYVKSQRATAEGEIPLVRNVRQRLEGGRVWD